MNSSAIITNIQKFSVHDGPGIRSIIFFKGCPLACEWCANPENINFKPELMVHENKCINCQSCIRACPQTAMSFNENKVQFVRSKCINCGACTKVCSSQARILTGEIYTVLDVKKKIDKDLSFYKNSGGGVTFSGGEPLLHPNFILEVAKDYKERGLNSAVETCGHVPWKNIRIVKPWIDLFLYDLKFVDNDKHKRYCKKGNELILENLAKLCDTHKVIVRMPIISGINDTERDLELAGAYLSSLKNKVSVHCLSYHNLGVSKYDALGIQYSLTEVEILKEEHLENIKRKLEKYGVDVQIGG